MEAGSKVKVYLGNVACCYGIATGRAKKMNGNTIYELQECQPFDTCDADYFRDATDVSFDIKFAKEIKTFNNDKRVYLNTGTFNYYKMKKECFKCEQKTLF
jgi:hypothetical protein